MSDYMQDYEKAAKELGISKEELDRRVDKFVHAEMVVSHHEHSGSSRRKSSTKRNKTFAA